MTTKRKSGSRLKAGEIPNVVRSLTVLDADASQLRGRLRTGRTLDPAAMSAICIIDVTCCIIDCSRCSVEDLRIYENPDNVVEGFLFRLPEQAENPEAPVYYVPDMAARTAFRLGHGAAKVPGGKIETRLLGIAGEMFGKDALAKLGIAPTASVIGLSAAKAPRAKAIKSASS